MSKLRDVFTRRQFLLLAAAAVSQSDFEQMIRKSAGPQSEEVLNLLGIRMPKGMLDVQSKIAKSVNFTYDKSSFPSNLKTNPSTLPFKERFCRNCMAFASVDGAEKIVDGQRARRCGIVKNYFVKETGFCRKQTYMGAEMLRQRDLPQQRANEQNRNPKPS